MHHRPVGPPLSARLSAATTRGLLLARRSVGARLTVAVLLCAVVTTLVLAVPVVSGVGAGSPAVTLGASSSSAGRESGSRVVMGLDGGAVSPSTESATTTTDGPRREQPTAAPETTGAAPVTSAAPPAPPAPVVVPEPAPSEAEGALPPVAAASPAPPEPAASPTAVSAPAPAEAPDRESEVLALVNAARATAACEPLVADAGLAEVARSHSEDMRDRDFFDHVNPDGLDPVERAEQAGQTNARTENIAYGEAVAAAVMDEWMDRRRHRANILDCQLRTLGVGVADGPGGPWWTLLFGD